MNILVLNAGSSSLKFEIWEMPSETLILQDTIERTSSMTAALKTVFEKATGIHVDAAGHRIVHGGDRFKTSVIIDAEVEKQIDALSALAPLHNPHNLEAYRAARQHLPNVPHVAVFDTAFHQTLPPHAYTYGLPYEYMKEKKIRRYGFHGISHRYVSSRFPDTRRLITCHLGNGCSLCAVDRGKSIDTSMGFTPLEGLVMGSRSGDVDAGAVLYLISHEGMTADELSKVLNNESGLKGLSGISNDMRDLLKSSDPRASLAVDTFCYRVKKYIGSYLAAMNGADALVFTGGIGENSAVIRSRICEGLDALGIALDPPLNDSETPGDRQIGTSAIPVWIVPTKEELLIARGYTAMPMNLHVVKLEIPENSNIILGQSHFIKTVEDLYEALVNTVPGIQFGVAFNEASGPCLTRSDGTDEGLRTAASGIATQVGAGHFFAIVMRAAFPINVLRAIQMTPEVCNIFCATANPVEVVIAETDQGRGVLGVIDGSSSKGVETEEDIAHRHGFLRTIGYKR